jgi:hypothetical protein
MWQAAKYVCMFLLFILVLLLPAHCRMGYDITANVDSTRWEIHRFTENMLFSKEENITGKGNFSRYRQINDIAGMNFEEKSYSLEGNLSYNEKLLMRTSDGPVVISIGLQDYSIPDEEAKEEEKNIRVGSSADISIDEKWPAYFADYKKISYLGPGITTRDFYDNMGDAISTSIKSWKLSKESYYRGHLNRTLIDANIVPGSVIERRSSNTSSKYSLLMKTTGEETHLGIVRQRTYTGETKFGRPDVYQKISQDYVGQLNMALNIEITNSVKRVQDADAWLDCCSGGYFSMPRSYWSSESGVGSNLTKISDCSCYQPDRKSVV